MIKTINPAQSNLIQECGGCQAEHIHTFASLSTEPNNNKVIKLPSCGTCNSVEFLLLNGGQGDHDMLVIQVFAYVNAGS